jgi:hypothetical protein
MNSVQYQKFCAEPSFMNPGFKALVYQPLFRNRRLIPVDRFLSRCPLWLDIPYRSRGSGSDLAWFVTLANTTMSSLRNSAEGIICKFDPRSHAAGRSPSATLHLYKGDITKFTGDAIVNAGMALSTVFRYLPCIDLQCS